MYVAVTSGNYKLLYQQLYFDVGGPLLHFFLTMCRNLSNKRGVGVCSMMILTSLVPRPKLSRKERSAGDTGLNPLACGSVEAL